MNDILNHATIVADSTDVADAPAMVSLTGWAATTDQDDNSPSLTVLKLSAEPAYVSLFTDQGLM